MRYMIVKFVGQFVFTAVGFLATCGLIFSAPLASPIDLERSNGSPIPSTAKSVDVPETEYRARLARIDALESAADFRGLVKEGNEIQAVWGKSGGERFAKLILELTSSLGYSRIDDAYPAAKDFGEKFAIAALKKSDTYSSDSELHLLLVLRVPDDTRRYSDAEVIWLRDCTNLWLHLLSRLQSERDPAANPYLNLQRQLRVPEDPRWSGTEDSAAKAKFDMEMTDYSAKRQWLSNQYRLRGVAEVAESRATKFLAKTYSTPPFFRQQLVDLLGQSGTTNMLRTQILKARDELASAK